MSISGLNIGTSALQANMVALEVIGQNIANVNNPDYTRQTAHLATSVAVPRSYGYMGTGVNVDQIQQIKDAFIDREIQGQTSDVSRDQAIFDAYERLQNIYDESGGAGLNAQLGDFFDALQDLASFPEDSGMRSAVLGQAGVLTNQVQFLNGELDQSRLDLDTEITSMVTEVNNLLKQVAGYNTQITQIEAGNTTTASDLRDKRTAALNKLAEYIDFQSNESSDGAINVSTSGRSLVFAGNYNQLGLTLKQGDELVLHNVVIDGTSDVINFTGGKIAGNLEARDTDIPSYIDNLDELAQTLINEMNKIHANGQGLAGFNSVQGTNEVSSTTAALNDAGLSITPADGTFQMVLTDSSGNSQTFTVTLDLDGAGADDSLEDLATNIDAESAHITATANSDGTLTIDADSGYTLTFQNDTTNVLAALGINTFFTGSDASDIAINSVLTNNPSLLAAAQSSNPGDNSNALAMAGLRDSQVLTSGTQTLEGFYQTEIARLGSEAQQIDATTEAGQTFLGQLQLRRESVSGVNLDEESADMIRYQQALQAAAKYVNVISEMLNVLVNGLI